jgi:UDP-glucuronate 4-epimerase
VLGTGEQCRDFTYVGDVVRANLLAAEAHLAPGTVLNVGTGVSTSVNRVMAIVEDLVGREVRRRDDQEAAGDPLRTQASSKLAYELLGWKPETSLEAGIAAQVEWHHARRTTT